ncbi:hypothetical protein BDZ97DRAFT_1621327, partial [Flammula alnicola]
EHLACNVEMKAGCTRCSIPSSRLCCDIHNPAEFIQYRIPAIPSTHIPARSRIKPNLTMSASNIQLRNALEDWREAATEQHYGYSSLVDFGGTLVMPTDVLNQIVVCAHFGKITTKDDLAKETRWDKCYD